MKAPREALLESLGAVPARVTAAGRAATPRGAGVGEWSTLEVVNHLVAVEAEVYQARFRHMAAEDRPRWEWVEPGPYSGPGSEALEAALAELARRRAATVASLRALDDAGWAREGVHATLGVLDVAGLALEALKHDEAHLSDLQARGGT